MNADAHIHLFKNGFFGAPGSQVGVQEYERLRVLGGIEEALVVGYEGDERYIDNNAYILELSRNRPWIKPLYYLDARTGPQEEEELRELRTRGYLGFSLYLDEDEESLLTWSASALRFFKEFKSIVSINAGTKALARAAPLISAMSSCTVLISHLGLPGLMPHSTHKLARERMGPLLELSRQPHVFVKLSAFYAVDPIYPYSGAAPPVEVLLEAFGASRLLWGSDFSPAMGYGSDAQIARIPPWLTDLLSPDELVAVGGQNLRQALQVVSDGRNEHLGGTGR